MTTRRWLIAALIAAVIIVPVGLKLARSEPQAVETEEVSLRAISPSILASGTLTYQSEVKLVPEVIGRVREVLVKEGDYVEQGQLLLRLDPTAALAEIAQLEAALRQSQLNIERQRVTLRNQQAKWERFQALKAQGLIDTNTYDDVAYQRELAEVELNTSLEMLKQTEAQLKQARERLAKTEFRAPISGTVTAVLIEVGETAVPSAMSIAGSDLMTVADTRSMFAEVNVDETDIARVAVGQSASVVPAAFPDQSWQGTVEHVALSPRQAAGQSKTYPVKIRLAGNQNLRFHPGMSCRVEIATRSGKGSKALAVPVQAVRYEQTGTNKRAAASVFVVEGGRARKRSVETGIADDTYIEIVRGLTAGESIVTGPAKILRFLKDGDRISVSHSAPAATQMTRN
ncbi:MAG: efflux RND transporter periplasmic adaptor subunit [Steroidobacteraceae bacterium]|nr:efflux RND transporter periplasmic adaptor subunit [Steroidobacteraceae bacterium]